MSKAATDTNRMLEIHMLSRLETLTHNDPLSQLAMARRRNRGDMGNSRRATVSLMSQRLEPF